MKIADKIKIIKDVTGLTQEKLARKLGVSFATLNSWFNERSQPHPRHQEQIGELYFKCTGQKVIPKDILLAKKDIIYRKAKKHRNILEVINKNSDIHKEYTLSLTYNSNSIEGSTLTMNQTAIIIFENATLPSKDLTAHLEAKNHQSAVQYLFRSINREFKIDEKLILKLHSILMNGIKEDAGNYRNHAVRIVGTTLPTANYLKVPVLMNELVEDISSTKSDLISQVAEVHSRFEQIHPFSDGNGRIGRLLIQAMLLVHNLPPAVIKQEKRRFYLGYLNKSQTDNAYEPLEKLLCDAILIGFKILERRS